MKTKVTSFIALLVLIVGCSMLNTTKAGTSANAGPPSSITTNAVATPETQAVTLTVMKATTPAAADQITLNGMEATVLKIAGGQTTRAVTTMPASLVSNPLNRITMTNTTAGDLPALNTIVSALKNNAVNTNRASTRC